MNVTFPPIILLISAILGTQAAANDPEAIWRTIKPSAHLTWVSCYTSGFECARLAVPLDYHSNATNATAAIALVRLPSSLSKDDKNYRGPVLFNPGGPGSSGVDWVVQLGASFQQILGNQFDIVGFDPRGVSRTTPSLRGFTNTEEMMTFSIKYEEDPPLGATPDSLARTYARFDSYGTVAETRLKGVAESVSAPTVARDMLAITKAHGFEKLSLWAISYGSIIGTTFASMFPQNVERLVLDGVVDAPDYYSGEYRANLFDTDKILEYMYEKCVMAGPLQCALYEKTPVAIKTRVDEILKGLLTQPIPTVIGTGPQDYGLVDYGMVMNSMFDLVYDPFSISGQTTFALLAALEKGNGSLWYEAKINPGNFLQCSCDETIPQDQGGFGLLGALAISCTDSVPIDNTLAELQTWYEANAQESIFAGLWPYRVICAGWKIRAAEKFDYSHMGGNTSFPILFIGNTADPVAPLAGAKKMSKLFQGSAVLTLDTPGHTSFAATSKCNALAVREYFQKGTLPKAGTVCPIESTLFGNGTASDISKRDDGLTAALSELRKKTKIPRFGRFNV